MFLKIYPTVIKTKIIIILNGPIFESSLFTNLLYELIELLISDDFSTIHKIPKTIRKTKSIIRSINIVPNNLSTGILSDFFRAVHLAISPALGINKFAK